MKSITSSIRSHIHPCPDHLIILSIAERVRFPFQNIEAQTMTASIPDCMQVLASAREHGNVDTLVRLVTRASRRKPDDAHGLVCVCVGHCT